MNMEKILSKAELMEYIKEFLVNCFRIRENPTLKSKDNVHNAKIYNKTKVGNYLNTLVEFKNNNGFVFFEVCWVVFLNYNQEVQNGIYPLILFDTKNDSNNFVLSYGESDKNDSEMKWPDFVLSKTTLQENSNNKLYKSYTINNLEDFELNKEEIIKELDVMIQDYHTVFSKSTTQENPEKSDNNINFPLNLILYGPPGTGKTYTARKRIKEILQNQVDRANTNPEKFYLYDLEEFKNLTWWQVIALSLYINGKNNKYKVSEIKMFKEIQAYVSKTNKTDAAIYTDLSERSDKANPKYLKEQVLFKFGDDKLWSLSESGIEYIENNYEKLIDKLNQNKVWKEEDFYKFITFHQSYSYEEFVEGIRPVLDTEQVKYIIKDGVLKEIANKAKDALEKSEINPIDLDDLDFNPNKNKIYKMTLGSPKNYEYCIKNNKISIDYDVKIDLSKANNETQLRELLKNSTPKAINQYILFKFGLKKGDLIFAYQSPNFTDIGKVIDDNDYIFDEETGIKLGHYHYRKVKWLKRGLKISGKGIYSSAKQTIKELDNFDSLKEFFEEIKITKEKPKNNNYVLIIDEINRGNISKIFGELITLIEDDKRLGAKQEIKVTLPYSSDEFGLPKNLYIIGTMNSTDKSIALIDVALRRRFEFEEVMPKPELVVENIMGAKVRKVFIDLNHKICALLDRDHQIGHSYFMEIEDLSNLKKVWFNQIIPLLNEYFYNDWGNLKKLLKDFVEEIDPEFGKYSTFKQLSVYKDDDEKFINDFNSLVDSKNTSNE